MLGRKIVHCFQGILQKSSRDSEEPDSTTDESTTPVDESIHDEMENEASSVQERAVVKNTKTEKLPIATSDNPKEPTLSVGMKTAAKLKSINHQIRVCLLHTRRDEELSRHIALSLTKEGFLVRKSGDILHKLALNHPKFAIAFQKKIDFLIPVVTEAFKTQIENFGKDEGNSLENEINYFLYDLASKEFSRSGCFNYRVRPVYASYEVVKSMAYDPLLQYCFHFQTEFSDLVENLQKTYLYLLKSKSKVKKCKRDISASEKSDVDDENNYEINFAEDKVALLIANDKYDNFKKLKSPLNDAEDLAEMLQSMDFKVIVVRNFSLQEMKAVIHAFCDMLTANSYALFYFAGHGFEDSGQTYFLPVDCSTKCLTNECISKEYILELVQRKKTALNVFLIDTCRKQLSGTQKPETVVVSMENNTVYGYATTFLNGSFEKGRKSFYVKHLKKYICKNICIEQVLLNVAKAFPKDKSIVDPVRPVIQYPVLQCSLSTYRKLCDPLLNPTTGNLVPWTVRQEGTTIEIPEINSNIILRTVDEQNLYFNRIVLEAFLEVKEELPDYLFHLEINIQFPLECLQVSPSQGRHLKPRQLKKNDLMMLIKKEIFGIQKMESSCLEGKVKISSSAKILKVADFSFKVGKINEMKVFLNKFENIS